jgi:hypothetical protein
MLAFNACMTAAFVQEASCAGITLTHLEIRTSGELLTGISRSVTNRRSLSGRLQYVIHVSGEARCISLNASISG